MTRRQETAAASRAETRRRLLESAAREFAASGYAAATVSRIAAGAGVTVQTLYLAWGSKRELLHGYMDSALASVAGARDQPYLDVRPGMVTNFLAPGDHDTRAAVQAMAHLVRMGAEHVAVGWQLYRDGAATDPAIAEDWRGFQRLRRGTFQIMMEKLPPGSLRPGLTSASAADTAWAVASPETYEVLVRHGGYSLDQFEEWVAETLLAILLPPAAETQAVAQADL